MQETIIKVVGLDCPSEEKLLKKALNTIPEVKSIHCNFITGELTVKHTEIKTHKLLEAIKAIGMQASLNEITSTAETVTASRKDWAMLIVSGLIAVSAELFSLINHSEKSLIVCLLSVLAILLGGQATLKKGLQALKTFTLNINFLMMIAIIGAFAIGEWPEAAMVTILFSLAELIERYSLNKARHAIQSLMAISPETARVKRETTWEDIPLNNVQINDIIWVKPGERIPLDGLLIKGESSINQSALTGESIPVDKQVGDEVYAGTLNEQGSFEFKVLVTQQHTMLAKIVQSVTEAQQQRAPTQRFVDNFSHYYTPIMVLIALLVAIIPPLAFGLPFMIWIYKALVLLVIACPCALVISTPVTIVSGLAAAARQGILIKGGTYLEQGYLVKVFAFDKTGTLTKGKPIVTDVLITKAIFDEQKILHYAASLDAHSDHPIAKAIVAFFHEKSDAELLPITQFSSIMGRGVKGVINEQLYFIGNHQFAEENKVCGKEIEAILDSLEQEGKTTIILSSDKEVLGVIAVADEIRPTTRKAIDSLHQMNIKTVMITGDNHRTANAIAKSINIDYVYANQLPQEKLTVIERLLKENRYVGMVGDGMNDAPALARSSIGFAMGAAGNDTALETADVALMEDNLQKLSIFLKISKISRRHLIENISFAITVKFIFFLLALFGIATLWMAVFADMGASLIVVFNGLRILKKKI